MPLPSKPQAPPQWISVKFGLSSFQVRVVFLTNFGLVLMSGFGGEMENIK